MECLLIFQLDKYNQRHKYQTHAPQTHPLSLRDLSTMSSYGLRAFKMTKHFGGRKRFDATQQTPIKLWGERHGRGGSKGKGKGKVAQMVKVKASVHAKWQLSDKINKKAASVSHKHTHAHTDSARIWIVWCHRKEGTLKDCQLPQNEITLST